MTSKVLIMSHPRCGSSNLLRFINRSNSVPCQSEPFNRRTLDDTLPGWQEMTTNKVVEHFSNVFADLRVAKHIYGQHPEDLDKHVPLLPDIGAIILLYRENTAAAALSALIAVKLKNFSGVADAPLGRIELEEIKRFSDNFVARRSRAIEHCKAANAPLLELSYETLFGADEERRKELDAVLRFMNDNASIPLPSSEKFERAYAAVLAPEKKINSEKTYQHIENLDEIVAAYPHILIA